MSDEERAKVIEAATEAVGEAMARTWSVRSVAEAVLDAALGVVADCPTCGGKRRLVVEHFGECPCPDCVSPRPLLGWTAP